MQKFDMSAAWDDAKRLLAAHQSMVWTIAGVFIFLPQLVMGLVAPTPAAVTGMTPEAQLEATMAVLWSIFPFALVAALLTLLANAAILRLWLSRTSISVADALKIAAGLILPLFLMQILASVATFIGFLLLIVPGIYVAIRFCVAFSYAVDMNIRNPIEALAGSWRLTNGNVLRIFLFLFFLTIAAFVLIILVSLFIPVMAMIPAIGILLGNVLNGAITTIVSVVFLAVIAAIYRQLVVNSGTAY